MSKFIDEFTLDIPRGVSTRYLKQQSVPQARWQSFEKIQTLETLSYNPDDPGRKILVGVLGDKLIGIDDNRHIMTVAGSRAGKSVTLISNLLCYQGSILATDPKAELANITAERRAGLGQKVYVLDPFRYGSDRLAPYRARYNPLAVLTLDNPTIIEDASLVTDALVVQPPNNSEPHWDECAKIFIEGIILHVATDPQYEGKRTLVTVRDLIKIAGMAEPPPEGEEPQKNPLSILEVEMMENAIRLEEDKATQDLAGAIEGSTRDFYEKSEKERDSVLSTVRRHTKFLDYSSMRDSLSGHDFDLADLKSDKNGVSIFLCFPATRIALVNRWLRLFINQLLSAMELEKTKPPAPVLLCLDEFPVLGYMRQLENAAGQIASFDVKLWVMIQDWSQGKALYKDRWETFTGNAGIVQFFGNNDLTTTEYISKRLGKTSVGVARTGEVGQKQQESGLSGRTSSIEMHDLLTPEEIMRQFARSDKFKRQLIMWAGYHPMVIQRVEYFYKASPIHRVFKGKFVIP